MEMEQRDKASRLIRILLVVRWPVGGIRTFMRYVYRRFPADSFQFVLIAPDQAETRVLLDDLAGLDLSYRPVSENPSVFELGWAVFRQLGLGRFDLVHSQGFTSGICAALPATLVRVPHLMTSHDVLGEKQFSGRLGFLKRLGMEVAFSLIGTIHSVSHDAQANLLGFFPTLRERCLVITNGIEVERFQQADPCFLRGELGVADDCFLIGFFGRFMGQKGFIYLVDAIENLSKKQNFQKNILVVAIGGGGFVREERTAISERGLVDFFRFLPFTPNVASVIKGLDLVVMPSLWEACPLLPMEVLTCGIPLLASNCVGLREVVRGTPTVVVEAGDYKALANGIKLCIEKDQRHLFHDFAPLAAKRYDVKATVTEILKMVIERVGLK